MRPEAEGDARELKTPTDNSPEGRCASPKAVSRTAERPASSVSRSPRPTPKTSPSPPSGCRRVRLRFHRDPFGRVSVLTACAARKHEHDGPPPPGPNASPHPASTPRPARRPSTWPRRRLHPVAEGGGSTSSLRPIARPHSKTRHVPPKAVLEHDQPCAAPLEEETVAAALGPRPHHLGRQLRGTDGLRQPPSSKHVLPPNDLRICLPRTTSEPAQIYD